MHLYTVQLLSKQRVLEDTHIFHFSFPLENFLFLPGQYVFIQNAVFLPDELHPFSIASSPLEKGKLEFCIKTYGDWTNKFSTLRKGTPISISSPQGNFTWDDTIQHAVFLLGGIGISPIMSILRFLSQQQTRPTSITILYGNRTPETIAYKEELETLAKILPLKLVHIFSHIDASHPWQGYRGFITKDIIKREITLQQNPTFFLVGSPIFIEKMRNALSELSVANTSIKQESLDIITPV